MAIQLLYRLEISVVVRDTIHFCSQKNWVNMKRKQPSDDLMENILSKMLNGKRIPLLLKHCSDSFAYVENDCLWSQLSCFGWIFFQVIHSRQICIWDMSVESTKRLKCKWSFSIAYFIIYCQLPSFASKLKNGPTNSYVLV